MAEFQFELEGVDELVRKLSKLRSAEIRKVYRQAIREAAKPVLKTAKQIAPIDTGALRRSIKIFAGSRSRRRISVVIKPGDRQQLGIPPDAKGYYPAHIEFGTETTPEFRYLRDAMELERADAIRTITQRIKNGLEKLATS